ncbi:hypothetical protein AK830_g4522 [Neonectria ditissima]|uniref:Uncharacterized protein n=1 Tax=Neonectria ditissima TaxID=78410 RepID=A0A0P7BMV4_9HYPO|nr:hypothetical protein AK830_g4522 [Neonectria ditissima]
MKFAAAALASAATATATATLSLESSRLRRGDTIHLRWPGVSAEHYPLALQARFFNDTDDGIFSIRTTIASGLTDDRFEWQDVPAPLDHVPGARYELVLVPEGASGPRVGYEGLFRVVEGGLNETDDGIFETGDELSETGGEQSSSHRDEEGGGDGRDAQRVAVGAGVGLGVGVPLALGLAWLLNKRRKYALGRRKREMED